MRHSIARGACAGAIAMLVVSGCGGGPPSTAHRDGGELVTVAVRRVGGESGRGSIVLAGRVKAVEEVSVTAPLAARLTELPIREGRRFARGQVLARFAAPETRDAVEAARARRDAAERRLAQAERDQARAESLWTAALIAPRDRENAEVDRRTAEAEAAAARAADRAMREATAVPAPFGGVVVRRRVDPGQWVAPGQALLDVRSAGVDGVEAAVPESVLPWLASARAWTQVGDGAWRPARMIRVDGMTDSGTRTRTAVFRPVGPAPALEPGAYARLRLEAPATVAVGGEGAGAVAVPATSVVRRGQLTGVFVIRDGAARLRWLRLGRMAGGDVEVLAGLTVGEEVALSTAGLEDGRAVRVVAR